MEIIDRVAAKHLIRLLRQKLYLHLLLIRNVIIPSNHLKLLFIFKPKNRYKKVDLSSFDYLHFKCEEQTVEGVLN